MAGEFAVKRTCPGHLGTQPPILSGLEMVAEDQRSLPGGGGFENYVDVHQGDYGWV